MATIALAGETVLVSDAIKRTFERYRFDGLATHIAQCEVCAQS